MDVSALNARAMAHDMLPFGTASESGSDMSTNINTYRKRAGLGSRFTLRLCVKHMSDYNLHCFDAAACLELFSFDG